MSFRIGPELVSGPLQAGAGGGWTIRRGEVRQQARPPACFFCTAPGPGPATMRRGRSRVRWRRRDLPRPAPHDGRGRACTTCVSSCATRWTHCGAPGRWRPASNAIADRAGAGPDRFRRLRRPAVGVDPDLAEVVAERRLRGRTGVGVQRPPRTSSATAGVCTACACGMEGRCGAARVAAETWVGANRRQRDCSSSASQFGVTEA